MTDKRNTKPRMIVLAVTFCIGVPATYLLFNNDLRQIHWLYSLIIITALSADIVFVRTLILIFKSFKIGKKLADGIKKMLSFIGRKIISAAEKAIGGRLSKGKRFIGGKSERSFVFESRNGRFDKIRKKMPKLPKNATERQRVRYEYISYVYKKEKSIPPYLTPSEVGSRLDPDGSDAPIFENYNGARYDKEQ